VKYTPRWLKLALFGLAVLAGIALLIWCDHRAEMAAYTHRRYMRYAPSFLIVGLGGAVGVGYLAWIGYWSTYAPWRAIEFIIPGALAALALVLVIQFLTVRHELLADGAVIRRFGGRKVQVKWADLRSIRYQPIMRWLRLETSSGVVVRASTQMIGLQPFARAMIVHAERAIADEHTRAALEGMAEDWAALDEAAMNDGATER
jgi:hypothetical protein